MPSPVGSTVMFRRVPADVRPRAISNFARALQRDVAKGRPFDCLITGDAELRRLNREFREQDRATDVLSFPLFRGQATQPPNSTTIGRRSGASEFGGYVACPRNSLGDVAISIARARAQAREFGHTTEQEIRVLMLHGVLHLMGMDHETDGGRMARAEKRWRARLGLPNGLIERVRR